MQWTTSSLDFSLTASVHLKLTSSFFYSLTRSLKLKTQILGAEMKCRKSSMVWEDRRIVYKYQTDEDWSRAAED